MNKRVEKRLDYLKTRVREIESRCKALLEDIEDVSSMDDMFVIESGFERIVREAETGREDAIDITDLFDEE